MQRNPAEIAVLGVVSGHQGGDDVKSDGQIAVETIPTSAADHRLRKAHEAISIRPTSGKMTFLSRKIFNALLYHAQRQSELTIYRIPLSELTASVDYDSKDTMLLRDHLRKMVETTVEWHDTKKRWGVGSLLSEAEIRFDGKKSFAEWSYGPKVRQFLLDPERYTPISLEHQALFRSHAGLTLFEICSRYSTNPSGLTNRASPEWWFSVLTGNPNATPDTHFYRYFKRDTLTPAIAEINAIAKIHVELLEHKKGRKVLEIQFAIMISAQTSLDLPPPPVIDSSLLDRITALGISKTEAEDIFALQPEMTLRATLTLVEDRVKNAKLPALDSPAAFFKSALRHGYAAKKPVITKTPESVSVSKFKEEDLSKEAARNDARARFHALDEVSQIALLAEFEAENLDNASLRRSLRKSGLKSKVVEAPFMIWLAARNSSQPQI